MSNRPLSIPLSRPPPPPPVASSYGCPTMAHTFAFPSVAASQQPGRPLMGTFLPSPPVQHARPKSRPATMLAPPPPSRAAAIVATQAIKKGAAGTSTSTSTPTSSRSSAAAKDNKRRQTHSQIERRRREKINDRLITLRNLVPACNEEMAARQRSALGLDFTAIAHGGGNTTGGGDGEDDGSTPGKRKRRRTRRKVVEVAKEKDGEPELGMHKLDVLTHTIDYIYQLQARIEELETGVKPAILTKVEREEVEDMVEENVDASPVRLYTPPEDVHAAEGKLPRGFTPTKRTSDAALLPRSPSASSETASEVSLPPQLTTPLSTAYCDGSPNFFATSSSSTRTTNTPSSSATISTITSPFMSLSASSPIFLSNGVVGKKGIESAFGTTAAAFKLPPAALSFHDFPRLSGEAGGHHGSTSSVRDAGQEDDEDDDDDDIEDATMMAVQAQGSEVPVPAKGKRKSPETDASSAARLLLAFSASPEEALRPIGGGGGPSSEERQRNIMTFPRMRRSTTISLNNLTIAPGVAGGMIQGLPASQQSPYANSTAPAYRRKFPGSAPGGSRATIPTSGNAASTSMGRVESLPSPPLLALDDQTGRDQQRQ